MVKNRLDKNVLAQALRAAEESKQSWLVHIPYSQTSGMEPDFEVEYEFLPELEREFGRPTQGMRCDFLYEGDDPKVDGIYMIWPEFLDQDGNVILDKRVSLAESGTATMWIGFPEARANVHRKRIKTGIIGYWVVGSRKIARVMVTKVIGLFRNPDI
jgi:hypothetical protein